MSEHRSGPSEQATFMRGVILEQFGAEVTYKEGELRQIEDRIRLAKLMLQRLRMGVLAQHYGAAGFYPSELDYSKENIGAQGTWETFEQGILVGEGSEVKAEPVDVINEEAINSKESTPVSPKVGVANSTIGDVSSHVVKQEPMEVEHSPLENHRGRLESPPPVSPVSTPNRIQHMCLHPDTPVSCDQPTKSCDQEMTSRFYRKKRIIVGNTSQYLEPSSQAGGSTHKWMAYVRGSQDEPDISHFVRAVRFFLHSSYHPHDIILINKPPYHLTKLGWGEFPVRVQLEFVDSCNKPVDIIHNLVLDRTHTGHQTLGAETVVDLDMGLSEVKDKILAQEVVVRGCAPNGISLPLMNGLDSDLVLSETKEIRTTETNGKPVDPIISLGVADENFPSLDGIDEIKLTEEIDQSDSGCVAVYEDDGSTAARCCKYTPKSQRVATSPVIIRHISLPLSSGSNESVFLDHDYCTAVVTFHSTRPSIDHSTSISRESSVTEIERSQTKSEPSTPQVLTTNLDKCLHLAVRSIPLCGRPSPSDGFLLFASTLSQFQSWSVGRRRATEWMRAVAVRRHVERQLKIPAVLTTKQVVQWCRRNGYTPLDVVNSESGFCKVCGCQLESSQQDVGVANNESYPIVSNVHQKCFECLKRFSTLSEPFSVFSEVVSLHDRISHEENLRELRQDVDIETLPTPQTTPTSCMTGEDESLPRFRVPQTPELKWIQQTAANIGIRVYPAVIDRMYAHVVEHMIYMSCARFLRAILVQATQEAGQMAEEDLCRERILTPHHIHTALHNLESCDFVTGKFLGVEGGTDVSDSESDSDSD